MELYYAPNLNSSANLFGVAHIKSDVIKGKEFSNSRFFAFACVICL